MKNILFKLALFIPIFLYLNGCDQLPGQNSNKQVEKTKARKERPDHAVEVVMVERKAVSIQRTLSGTLEAPRIVHIHSEQAGRIIQLPYYEGDSVKKGTVLTRLDDALLQAGFAKVVATRKQVEVDLKRLQKLLPSKLTTEDEVARAITEVELAQAEESLQKILLSRTVIKAPFAGIISDRLKEPSDVVALNDHILTMFDPKIMTASIQLPEQLHGRVAIGDPVETRIDSLGDQIFNAEILRIHPILDAGTRQGTVEIILNPIPTGARPGQLCRVTMQTAKTDRLLIPLKALQFDARGSFVYRVDESFKTKRQAVVTGLQFDELIEIIDGVNENDKVVSQGFLGLKSGKKVRVVNPLQKTSSLVDPDIQSLGSAINATEIS
ncbi:MAG: efflux RND transporter periplasmic adaptor subunit [Gammaproteobacteria bacterium]|nr:efflux RND transporter periplasmic adaptor subunit [Gammaproteobacteria bacterium]